MQRKANAQSRTPPPAAEKTSTKTVHALSCSSISPYPPYLQTMLSSQCGDSAAHSSMQCMGACACATPLKCAQGHTLSPAWWETCNAHTTTKLQTMQPVPTSGAPDTCPGLLTVLYNRSNRSLNQQQPWHIPRLLPAPLDTAQTHTPAAGMAAIVQHCAGPFDCCHEPHAGRQRGRSNTPTHPHTQAESAASNDTYKSPLHAHPTLSLSQPMLQLYSCNEQHTAVR